MLLATDYNWAFIHIPKTAGCSILLATGHLLDDARPVKVAKMWQQQHHTGGMHDTYPMAKGKIPDGARVAAFVRNPFDRFVSLFNYARNGWLGKGYRQDSFEGFVEDFASQNPRMKKTIHMPLRDQQGWLQGAPDPFIGRFERIEEDFARMCREFGMPELELPHTNRKEPRPPYQAFYTPHIIERVGKLLRRDLDLYGYSFDG